MGSKGWIKLHRRIQDHWIYQEKRQFSRYEAWLDLIMLANHKDNKTLMDGELVAIVKGSFITSKRELGRRWDWSNSKVDKFLVLLESDEMITYKSDTKKTVITIVKYEVYHELEKEKRHENETETEQKHIENETETNKQELKELKNLRTKEFKTVVVEAPQNDLSAVFHFYEQNGFGTIGSYISEKIIMWSDDLSEVLVLEALKQSVENGKKFWSYTEAILKKWADKKITTVEQAHAAQLEHKEKVSQARNTPRQRRTGRQEKLPEWFVEHQEQKESSVAVFDEELEAKRRRLEAIQQKYKQGG